MYHSQSCLLYGSQRVVRKTGENINGSHFNALEGRNNWIVGQFQNIDETRVAQVIENTRSYFETLELVGELGIPS